MKTLTIAALLSSFSILQTAASSSLTVQIPPNNILPNPHVLPPNTHATLTTLPQSQSQQQQQQQHIISAPLTHTAEFHFSDLPSSENSESYLLDIRSKEYIFAPYRVDIAADGSVLGIWETFRGNQWENRGMERYTKLKGQEHHDVTVQAHVVARRGFYEIRPKFSPLDLFKNPMILLSVFALVATLGIPKLLENMDPEMREEFEKQSRSSPLSSARQAAVAGGAPGGGGAPGFDLAGWMAGTAPSPLGPGSTGAAAAAASGRESGAGARRR
ncbi:hypothetical protein UA08_07686 [Talaromyces atroroseus]|uniref:ER membrane protein complex subunit 7 beta-sandwich domain-containing protein n=1 Tax=Talaromyces atroroseus TaxID=1441469 RepID=A0A225ARZ7_TALAT|nr:hypothetical protein UA08_07686 [Talaromyces atroroseus]OKL57215.1 hypothetical protein UA08_07686 [Talaromyces atroroseus]